MFHIKNHGELENKDGEFRSVSLARDTEQNLSFTHTFFQTHGTNSDYLESDQIQKYSKAPTYTQVYTTKGNNRETIPNYSKEPLYN